MQASTNHEQGSRKGRTHGGPFPARRRALWVLVPLAILLAALVAFGSTRGWRPPTFIPFAAAPDLTATAVADGPELRRAAEHSAMTRIASLACACDRGLAAWTTGTALTTRTRTIALLARQVRRRTTTIRGWHVDSERVLTPTTGAVTITAAVTEWLYQGLVVEERIDRTYREQDDLVLARGRWKVGRIRTSTISRRRQMFSSAPATTAAATYILDDTAGRAIYADNADSERLVASTAKMVTALTALRVLPLWKYITVPADAAVPGTSAGLAPGEVLRVRDAVYGMLLPSGNDAAVTLADAAAGSVPAFAALMNAEVSRLRLVHSHFVTPHGLDSPGQYSSAHDLAWIAHALLLEPFLASVVRTQSYRAVSAGGAFVHQWTNLNHLLGTYRGAIGVKTGTTPGAGANLVAAAIRGGRRIIVVLLGDTPAARYPDAIRLLNYGWRLVGESAR